MKRFVTSTILLLLIVFTISSCDLLDPFSSSSRKAIVQPSDISLSIERTYNSIQGQYETVEIILKNNADENYELGGIDLLIAYESSALSFQSAEQGDFLNNCAWEYFTFRHEIIELDSTNIYTVRITTIADLYPPPQHPLCYTPTETSTEQLFVLNFLVTNDRNFEGKFAPIQFYWEDCGGNTLSNLFGDQLYVSRNIYSKIDTSRINYSHNLAEDIPFPSYSGYNNSCDTLIPDSDRKPVPIRNIDFINGGIDIASADSIDLRPCRGGDLTGNGTSCEIADAVLYSNYFVYGMSVFTAIPDCQIKASDVNGNGLALTLADLVYLIKVILGDIIPYPNLTDDEASYRHDRDGNISVLDDIKVSAVHLVLEDEVTPTLLAPNMTMIYNFDGTNTNILIFSLENNNFTGNLINIGDAEIVSIAMADYFANQLILTEE